MVHDEICDKWYNNDIFIDTSAAVSTTARIRHDNV